MKLQEIVDKISERLPIESVSEQDNVGLVVGDYDADCEKITLAYELNEGVLRELVESRSNLLVTYHTPLFRPKKSFTTSASKPDPLFWAARASVNVFSVHTALDVCKDGLNFDLAARLGLKDVMFLSPLSEKLCKIVVFVPPAHADKVRAAMSKAGAGAIGNYSDCSFAVDGEGTFTPNAGASPYIGQAGKFEMVDEVRLEMMLERALVDRVVDEMLRVHPYEEPAYDIYPLLNEPSDLGIGAIGEIEEPQSLGEFTTRVKDTLGLNVIKVSNASDVAIKKVALCVGSGVSFYRNAVRKGADIFITGDVRHHDFREAEVQRTILADVTHIGSERFVIDVMWKIFTTVFSDAVVVATSKCKSANGISI